MKNYAILNTLGKGGYGEVRFIMKKVMILSVHLRLSLISYYYVHSFFTATHRKICTEMHKYETNRRKGRD